MSPAQYDTARQCYFKYLVCLSEEIRRIFKAFYEQCFANFLSGKCLEYSDMFGHVLDAVKLCEQIQQMEALTF